MKYNLSSEEKIILKNFKSMRIPSIFKEEYIEHMLFIELVDFDICTYLLEEKKLPDSLYKTAMSDFDFFKNAVDVKKLEKEEYLYYKQCCEVMEIFKQHCSE